MITDVRSYTLSPRYIRLLFERATDEQLRAMLRPIGDRVGRAQLLALARNRWKCGYFIEYLEAIPAASEVLPRGAAD